MNKQVVVGSTSDISVTGLMNKYILSKANGNPVDPHSEYFILKLDSGAEANFRRASRLALQTFCHEIRNVNPALAKDLEDRYLPENPTLVEMQGCEPECQNGIFHPLAGTAQALWRRFDADWQTGARIDVCVIVLVYNTVTDRSVLEELIRWSKYRDVPLVECCTSSTFDKLADSGLVIDRRQKPTKKVEAVQAIGLHGGRELSEAEVADLHAALAKVSTQPDGPSTASGFLENGHNILSSRAAEYDPNGQAERSMASVVIAFNAITLQDLTEAQGWEFMSVLKQVRAFRAPSYHPDSVQDNVNYAALMGEALYSEKPHKV